MKHLFFMIFFQFFFSFVFAQSVYKEDLNLATTLNYDIDFSGAIRLYKQMINFDPFNANFYYKLGYAYLNTFGKQDSAIFYFKKALQNKNKTKDLEFSEPELKYYLAKAYRLNGDFDSAVILLENLLKESFSEDIKIHFLRELKLIELSLDTDIAVKKLDTLINTKYCEHSPVFCYTKNFLLFTSKRYSVLSLGKGKKNYDENIFISYFKNGKWTPPEFVDQLNTEYNEATVSFSPKNTTFLIYESTYKGDIYETHYTDTGWTEPERLPYPINSKYRETHASFSFTQDTIYFTSDRPGGLGGLDIYMSVRLNDSTWAEPINLRELNSKYDEKSPFVSFDGKKIYFSSNREGTLGGFDIFVAQKTGQKWSEPKNLGFPINSVDDDLFYFPLPKSKKAFFTSQRFDTKGFGDIYLVDLDSNKLNLLVSNIGIITDTCNFDSLKIYLLNLDKGTENQYFINNDGRFIFYTEKGFSYNLKVLKNQQILFEDKFFVSENTPNENFYKKISLSKDTLDLKKE